MDRGRCGPRLDRAVPGKLGTASVYGVSLDPVEETRDYAAEHALPFPIIPVEAPRFGSYYRTKVVPLTLVIDSAGQVLLARSQTIEPGSPTVDSILAAALPDMTDF